MVKSMTYSDFRIRLDKAQTQWVKCQRTGQMKFADTCVKLCNELLEDLNCIAQFENQQDRIDIETICFNRAKKAIEDQNTCIVDLQIAKLMYDNSYSQLDNFSNLVKEAKEKVQNIIDSVEAFIELGKERANQMAVKTAPKS